MPFEGKDLHKFTFRNVCAEDPELELGDGTYKIFLTPAGTADDISKEMRELMSYMADNKAESDFTVRLENAVNAIKKGEGWRREYMQLKEKMDAQYEAGKSDGKEKGMEDGINLTLEVLSLLNSGEKNFDTIAKACNTSVETVKKIAQKN